MIFDTLWILVCGALFYKGAIDKTTFVLLTGPLIGARIAAHKQGPRGPMGPSGLVALALGVWSFYHRSAA